MLIDKYCIACPEEAKAYSDLKRELLAKYADEPEKYGPAKNDFVLALQDRAFAWARQYAPMLIKLKNMSEDYPDRIAVIDKCGKGWTNREINYLELYELSGRVASKLKLLGTKRGVPVIVCVDKSAEFYAAVFGILMARGIVIPTRPSYSDARIEEIKNDSGALCIIREDFFDDIDNYEAATAVHIADDETVWIHYNDGPTSEKEGLKHSYKEVNEGIGHIREFLDGLDESMIPSDNQADLSY